jgi:hypothetical protein
MDFTGLNISYESLSCGQIRFGWRGEFQRGDEWLRLELDGYRRECSSEI